MTKNITMTLNAHGVLENPIQAYATTTGRAIVDLNGSARDGLLDLSPEQAEALIEVIKFAAEAARGTQRFAQHDPVWMS